MPFLVSPPPRAFTLEFNGISPAIIDDVGVSIPYNPSSQDPRPEIKRFAAIWDTGASMSVITPRVISALQLHPIDKREAHTANGVREASIYLVNIYLRNRVAFPVIRVMDGNIQGADVAMLIGMDIIGSGDFAVTHAEGRTCMSFQVPSQRKINFVRDIDQHSRSQRNKEKAARRKQRGK